MSRPSWIGQTLGGRYQIQEIVGQGGMSAVYKAMDPNLQRVVAVKLVHPHLADDPKFVERFEEEARAVAQLRHPNIVQVYDFDSADDVYYMVQEFVPGETLQQRLRRLDKSGRKMALDEVVKYTLDILNAMGYAHQRGMIHRDIKPANIMLDVMGRAILMDFGIVKIMGGQKHTATGAVVGTAMYMCPEMIRGEQPDARSDIYSLGVTMFEMVNGRPPFEAESAMTLMMMHLNDPLPNLHSMQPEVPGDLVAVIEKALAKDPADRYRSTAEMAAALSRVQDRLRSGIPFDATMVEEDLGVSTPAAAEEHEPEARPEAPSAAEQAAKGAAAAAAGAAASQAQESRQPPQDLDRQADPKEALPYDSTPEGTLIEPPVDTGQEASRPATGAAPVEGKMGVGSPPAAGGGGGAANRSGVPGAGQSGAGTGPSGAGGVQGGGPPSAPAGAPAGQPAGGRPNWLLYAAGGLLVIAVVAVVSLLIGSRLGGGDEQPGTGLLPDATTPAVETEAVLPSETPTFTPEPTATETLPPTETPTITPTPTLDRLPTRTPPPGQMFVRINSISLMEDGHYEVNYETFEYTETLPGDHVHFFWNTVTEANAGSPGSGPWILYGGPRPFTQYAASQRPANAGAMCALVANPNHSIQPGSGTCWPLPDVPVVTALEPTQCLSNPSGSYEVAVEVPKWENMYVKGTLESGGWYYVANPQDKSAACWVPEGGLFSSGDWSGVPAITPSAP